jgi:hypothetical protein
MPSLGTLETGMRTRVSRLFRCWPRRAGLAGYHGHAAVPLGAYGRAQIATRQRVL